MFTSLRLKLTQQQLLATETMWAIAALVGGMFVISFGPIFIRLGEGELGPNATIFNRFWLATVVFGLWNILCDSFTANHRRATSEGPVAGCH